jgi:CubicO group peptidase (beta-lactamase class C family)
MKSYRAVLVLSAFFVPGVASHAAESPRVELPRSSPEAQGISSAAILAFIETADAEIDAMNSFMLLRHGHVVAEGWWAPYTADSPHVLFSLSKSFTSTAVGMAVAEGKLSIDDPVLDFFPEDAPADPSANLKAMRVRDLLTMSAGHQTEVALGPDRSWTQAFLAHPVPHKPGAHFLYNTPATYMQSAIVQKVTGEKLLDYLRPRLFEPLGIQHPTWGESPQGITLGGYGLSVTTEDIARFGLVYVQNGQWQGRQLLPASWVQMATARQTSNGSNPQSDWEQGYGFQFWRCRHGLYRGDGAFGQFCIVMPEQDAVVAITSGVRSMPAVMNLVWETILPAFQASPLTGDEPAHRKLKEKLAKLSLRLPAGAGSSPQSASVSGRRFVFPDNDRNIASLALEFGDSADTLVVHDGSEDHRIVCGHGAWHQGETGFVDAANRRLVGSGRHRVAASAAWTNENTYTAKLCLYETPFYVTFQFQFVDGQLLFDSEYNVAFGPTKQPQLVGRAE